MNDSYFYYSTIPSQKMEKNNHAFFSFRFPGHYIDKQNKTTRLNKEITQNNKNNQQQTSLDLTIDMIFFPSSSQLGYALQMLYQTSPACPHTTHTYTSATL